MTDSNIETEVEQESEDSNLASEAKSAAEKVEEEKEKEELIDTLVGLQVESKIDKKEFEDTVRGIREKYGPALDHLQDIKDDIPPEMVNQYWKTRQQVQNLAQLGGQQ